MENATMGGYRDDDSTPPDMTDEEALALEVELHDRVEAHDAELAQAAAAESRPYATACDYCERGLVGNAPRVIVEGRLTACGEGCAARLREMIETNRRRLQERSSWFSAKEKAAARLRQDVADQDAAASVWAAAAIAGRQFASREALLCHLTEAKKAEVRRSLTLTETYRITRTVNALWQQGGVHAA